MYFSFFKKIVKINTLFIYFLLIMKKGIPHFKFTPFDYGYSDVYLQKCKVTGKPILLIALLFCLKVGI